MTACARSARHGETFQRHGVTAGRDGLRRDCVTDGARSRRSARWLAVPMDPRRRVPGSVGAFDGGGVADGSGAAALAERKQKCYHMRQ